MDGIAEQLKIIVCLSDILTVDIKGIAGSVEDVSPKIISQKSPKPSCGF